MLRALPTTRTVHLEVTATLTCANEACKRQRSHVEVFRGLSLDFEGDQPPLPPFAQSTPPPSVRVLTLLLSQPAFSLILKNTTT